MSYFPKLTFNGRKWMEKYHDTKGEVVPSLGCHEHGASKRGFIGWHVRSQGSFVMAY